MMLDEEGALIERLQRRDPAAIADLYSRYGHLTYSLIVRIVRDEGIAEDLTRRLSCGSGPPSEASTQDVRSALG